MKINMHQWAECWLKTRIVHENKKHRNPVRCICIQETIVLINTHNRGVPAPHSSTPTHLSALFTLNLIHIKEPTLQVKKDSGRGKESPEGRTGMGGGGEGGEQAHSYCLQTYHSKQINSNCYLPHLTRPWTRPGRNTRKSSSCEKTMWKKVPKTVLFFIVSQFKWRLIRLM